jgi:Domain of unkown function (DUF1775)
VRRMVALGATAAAGLVLAAAPAAAHNEWEPGTAAAGSVIDLTLFVEDEQPDAGTTTVELFFPAPTTVAALPAVPGWTATPMDGEVGGPASGVTRAGGPAPSDVELPIRLGPLLSEPGRLQFKTVQTYDNGGGGPLDRRVARGCARAPGARPGARPRPRRAGQHPGDDRVSHHDGRVHDDHGGNVHRDRPGGGRRRRRRLQQQRRALGRWRGGDRRRRWRRCRIPALETIARHVTSRRLRPPPHGLPRSPRSARRWVFVKVGQQFAGPVRDHDLGLERQQDVELGAVDHVANAERQALIAERCHEAG